MTYDQPHAEESKSHHWFGEHDLAVVVVSGLALLACALLFRAKTAPELVPFSERGLEVSYPASFLPMEPVSVAPTRLAIAALFQPASAPNEDLEKTPTLHVSARSAVVPSAKLELRVTRRPDYQNWLAALALRRSGRYGATYWADDATKRTIGKQVWNRTHFQYAHMPTPSGSPTLSSGIEYASVSGENLYVVTFHGPVGDVEALEQLIAPTVRVNARGAR